MRAAAISMPRLDRLPGMFFSANPKDLKEPNHSLLDDKTQKKKPKTFGMDVKAYLRSMIPHLDSGMKSSKSKDILSAEEVMQWSQSLEKLLANQTGQSVFGNFLKSEFSEENIEFWLACEDYKKTESDLLSSKAEDIYKAFVCSDAVKQTGICTYLENLLKNQISRRSSQNTGQQNAAGGRLPRPAGTGWDRLGPEQQQRTQAAGSGEPTQQQKHAAGTMRNIEIRSPHYN
ncbi:Regulator of G-protein signaling 1 [Microtus ochrogaster]|uniref:Regulator of G-protein signaling 1 n=1 Tax=Microtus ochrogaster TaxID=79684 RepID=A0A8J6H3G8_MICOH|nr:Regulator of G-protein signaling 1 [Microtus ochrogaster]